MNALHRHSGYFRTLAHLSGLYLLQARLLDLEPHHSSKEQEQEPRRVLVGSRAVLKLQALLGRRLHRS